MDNLLLIDGNSLINRAFYALPPLTNVKGEPTQAVYGFTTMLIKAIADFSPKYIAVAFDLPKPTFRHKLYDGYKATRKKMPEELAVQLPILKAQLTKMGIAIVELEGYEADDIIGTLAKDDEVFTYIITGDRDSLQLISPTTSVVLTKRGITDTVIVNEQVLKEQFSLTPSGVIEYKALAGDSSDNIPGIAGVGEKTALGLLEKYGDLDGIYAHADDISGKLGERIRTGEESARLSKVLATINCEVPLTVTTADFTYNYPFSQAVKQSFIENGFKSIYKRDELFILDEQTQQIESTEQEKCEEIVVTEVSQIEKALSGATRFCFIEGDDIRISCDGKTEYIIPIARTLLDQAVNYSTLLKTLKPYFEDEKVKKIVFDGKKVMRSLDASGIKLVGYDDARLMQYLADMRIKNEIVTEYIAECGYNAQNPSASLVKIYDTLVTKIASENMARLYEIELKLEGVLYRMEKRGVKIDLNLLAELGKEYEQKITAYDQEICDLAGKKFNINSPKQLAEVLFEDLQIPYPKKNTTKYSTNAEILESILDKHEIVPLVMKYRFVSKLNSTYIEGMRKLATANGIIHTEYNQMLTSTGRLSSSEPNLQNIPVREEDGKRLRGLFVAREGYTLISADYSQIELRLLAHFAQDKIMLEQYRDGADIHTRTAAEIFGVSINEVTSKMRREAKTINFGIIYGMSDYGLSQSLKCSVATARQYMKRYFERFPAIKPYFDGVVATAKENGYTTTLLGRKRYIPELVSSNAMRRSFGERAAMNMPLQGSAADIIKLAMVEVDKRLENLKSKLLLQIHDELIIESADDEIEQVKSLLVECMENAVELTVPLTVDVSSGKSWLDC